MATYLQQISWRTARLEELMEQLSQRSGLYSQTARAHLSTERATTDDNNIIDEEIEAVALSLGIEAAPADITYATLPRSLRRAGPAIVRLPAAAEHRLLGILKSTRHYCTLLGPNLLIYTIPIDVLCPALHPPKVLELIAEVENAVRATGILGASRSTLEAALISERCASVKCDGIWLLRSSPGAPFARQLREAALFRPIAGLVIACAGQYLCGIGAWWLIGASVLRAHLNWGCLLAWALSLFTILPLRIIANWYQGVVAFGCGALLKKRLLYGALRLQSEQMRTEGVGQLLARVIESEAIESLALSAGLIGLIGIVEVVGAVAIISVGAGGLLQASLFVMWMLIAVSVALAHWMNCTKWVRSRLDMTDMLVENMIGHETRLAQENQGGEQRHSREDVLSEGYIKVSRRMDRTAIVLFTIIPNGWPILSIAGLIPAFVGGGTNLIDLAVSLGGTLLGISALQKLVSGIGSVGEAVIAWQQVGPLYYAADDRTGELSSGLPVAYKDGSKDASEPIVDLHEVVYRYPGKSQATLRGVTLQIWTNDRLLLEGPSGCGKSTFAALLAGLRVPESGVILSRGLDYKTVGSVKWRRRIALAPQFHENHVLADSLAFNLLMGRAWPPKGNDLVDAEEVCKELGLGELLERMPNGLAQIVGEGAWQLSHGECSRLFVARALLQNSDLTILDESLTALDPQNVIKVLATAFRRTAALLVIAHL